FLEEAYEVCDAIELQDATALCEELGDVLLNVIFQVQLAEEAGQFDFQAVTTAVCRKLIDRHSYVFTDPSNPVPAADQTEALKQWEANKRQEKQQRSYLDTLNGVARALPALRRAQKLQSKAQKAGLKLRPDRQQIMAQLAAVSTTLEQPDQARPGRLPGSTQRSATAAMQQAAGSLLFSLVAYLAERQIDPEAALDQTNQTFVRRFAAMEQQAMARGQSLDELEVNQLWQAEQQPDPENIN
ncbi:MAG: MazG family protein, partial [Oscillospiraceae bacterium]|nr:MazG family protein [Oscillospiraceae bacterium]